MGVGQVLVSWPSLCWYSLALFDPMYNSNKIYINSG